MAKKSKADTNQGLARGLVNGLLLVALVYLLSSLALAIQRGSVENKASFINRFQRSLTLQAVSTSFSHPIVQAVGVAKGEAGPVGPPGADGKDGKQGIAGLVGPPGERGAQGAAGAQASTSASDLSSGTLADARLSSNVTLQGNSFNGASQLVQLTAGGIMPALSGANLTALNASNISSGSLGDSRLSSNVTLQGNSFNGASQLVQLTAGGIMPALSGANLTALNASNISSGTLADARLSANVALLDGTGPQTFTGNNQFNGSLKLGSSGTALSQIRIFSATIDPSTVSAVTTSEQTFTVSGLATSDTIIVNKPSHTSGCGIVNARVSASNTLALTFMNVLPALTCDPGSETYTIVAFR